MFGCSQTLNSKCWKSGKPTIFRPMTQPYSWHTSSGEERRVESMTLFLPGWLIRAQLVSQLIHVQLVLLD